MPTASLIHRTAIALAGAALTATLSAFAGPAAAEGTIRIAEQYGIGYLPLHVIRHQHLIEKHGKADGLDIDVEWTQLSGGASMNDALLSDSIDFASAGVGPTLTIWDRTKGSANVKAVASMNNMPLFLTTNNPAVKTVKDLTDKDKIALPAVKVGIQARILQMAAEQAFGAGKSDTLDRLTVSLPHPDGSVALLSGTAEITSHLSAPPYQYQQLADPKIHKVFSSYDVLGGPHSFNLVYGKESFRAKNPKTYKAFLAALRESVEIINRDHAAAADAYAAVNKSDLDRATFLKILDDPDIQFTVVPKNTAKFAEFMSKVGAVKNKPSSWKDYFFEDLHNESGS